MSLPKITQPTFEFTIPSSKQKIKMRPMLVKEEKILLISKASGERYDIMNGIKQVVNNCIVSDSIDIDNLAIFDVEYLFLKLRAISISNIAKVTYEDIEDKDKYDFDINLDEIEVNMENLPTNSISVDKNTVIELRWPTIGFYATKDIYEAKEEDIFDLMVDHCLNKVIQKETTFDARASSPEERKEFIESLPAKVADQIRAFIAGVPTLKHEIKYSNKMGSERKIVLDTLDDFFML